jgi:hypothetical protein
MAFAKKVAQLLLFLGVCFQDGFANERSFNEKKISLDHLSNGLTYCLSQEDVANDQISIQLLVKFEDSNFSDKEQILAKLTQDYIIQALKCIQSVDHKLCKPLSLSIDPPQVYLYPHITLYQMHLYQPTQEGLDNFLSFLSKTLDSLSIASLHDAQPLNVSPNCQEDINLIDAYLTAQDLQEFAAQYYTFEKMILMIAGNLSALSVSESINKHFSNFLLSKYSYQKFSKDKCFLQAANNTPELNRWLVSPYKVEDPRYNTFEDIPLHEKEEKVIEKLMRCLASSSVPKLIWKQNDLQKLGKAINHVHPLKFISHIINQPILRSDLQEVHRNYFKWRGFLDGFRRRMTEEFYKDTLKDLIPGFAQSVDVRPEIVEHFVERRDWEGLVKSILY